MSDIAIINKVKGGGTYTRTQRKNHKPLFTIRMGILRRQHVQGRFGDFVCRAGHGVGLLGEGDGAEGC